MTRAGWDYNPALHSHRRFVPTMGGGFGDPTRVYTNPKAAVMGFPIVDSGLGAISTLRLSADPPSTALVKCLLAKPPLDISQATLWYEYMGTRLGTFSTGDLRLLKEGRFIPVVVPATTKLEKSTRLVTPSEVYLSAAGISSEPAQFHRALFAFVTFGEEGDRFLKGCGVKNEPSIKDLAALVVDDSELDSSCCW